MSAGVICGDSGGGGGGGCVDRLSQTRLQRCADVIVNAQYCPACADHITCSTCLQVRRPHHLLHLPTGMPTTYPWVLETP